MAESPNTVSVVEVDPGTLLTDVNVRADAKLDKPFIDSIRDLGVLVPIVAVRTAAGELRVRFGNRRTLAAIEAKRSAVPVVVVADEANDKAGEVERLVGQYAENEHRKGLTSGEKVEVFSQMAAFGVSAAQIAKRTKAKRDDVDAGLKVAKSELAKAAAERYDFLDLEQAAAVAEFDGDDEAVTALVVAAKDGRFDHKVESLRRDRAVAAEEDQVVAELTAQGVTVIEEPEWGDLAKEIKRQLTDGDGNDLTPESHASCPGHAAFLEVEEFVPDGVDEQGDDAWQERVIPVYVCTDPEAHGHKLRWGRSAAMNNGGGKDTAEPVDDEAARKAAEKARDERRTVIANNKAWAAATTVRKKWLTKFLSAAKPAPAFSQLDL